MTFGDKLTKLRKQKNLTQEQLADMLGVSRQSVSKWESDTAYPETDKQKRKHFEPSKNNWLYSFSRFPYCRYINTSFS